MTHGYFSAQVISLRTLDIVQKASRCSTVYDQLLSLSVGRESTDSETLKLSPSTERRIELKLKEYRAPLTATKSCDSPVGGRRRRAGEVNRRSPGESPRAGGSGEVASDQAKGSPSLVRIRRLDSKARADLVSVDSFIYSTNQVGKHFGEPSMEGNAVTVVFTDGRGELKVFK